MIKISCTFFSECLGRNEEVLVLLPNSAATAPSGRYPTLYLLHGLSDSACNWITRTSLERYCDDHELAVVLPNAERSFYCDMAYGDNYFTYVSKELPAYCEAIFPVTTDGASRYIAGNSMGGYGAYKIALRNPGRYAKAGALSGVMDMHDMIAQFPVYEKDWLLCFGGNQVPESEDLFVLLKQAKEDGTLIPLYQYCGTDDFLAEGNRRFSSLCQRLQIPVTTVWETAGYHVWDFWDSQLPALLKWLTSEK